MSNTIPPRIEQEAKLFATNNGSGWERPSFNADKMHGYRIGATDEYTRIAPVVKALERAINVIDSECDDPELMKELKQILETYKADV